MIERNAILINGGSAADVDRALTAVATTLVGWSQSSKCRARGGTHPEKRGVRGADPRDDATGERRAADVRGSDALAIAPLARGPGKPVATSGSAGSATSACISPIAMGASITVINHMEQQMDDASRFADERSRKSRPT